MFLNLLERRWKLGGGRSRKAQNKWNPISEVRKGA